MNVLGKGLWAVPPGIPPFGPCLCGWLKGGAWRWYSWLILPKELYNVKYVCKAGVHWILATPVGDCLFSREQPPTHTNFLSQTLGRIHYVYSWAEKRTEASQGQEHREAWALGSSLRVHKRWWGKKLHQWKTWKWSLWTVIHGSLWLHVRLSCQNKPTALDREGNQPLTQCLLRGRLGTNHPSSFQQSR